LNRGSATRLRPERRRAATSCALTRRAPPGLGVHTTRRPRRASSPCAVPRGLGVLPAARTPWTTQYRPVHAADRRFVGSTSSYACRSRWPCYGSISSVTATSPRGLNYKNPSVIRPPRTTPTRRPPFPPPPCAHASASSHRRPTFPTYSLGPVARSQATPCQPCALPLPEAAAAATAGHHRAPTPATPLPNYGHPPNELHPLPGWEHRRNWWIPASPRRPLSQGPNCISIFLLGEFCAKYGYGCESAECYRGLVANVNLK
jgi:hypothetical protein